MCVRVHSVWWHDSHYTGVVRLTLQVVRTGVHNVYSANNEEKKLCKELDGTSDINTSKKVMPTVWSQQLQHQHEGPGGDWLGSVPRAPYIVPPRSKYHMKSLCLVMITYLSQVHLNAILCCVSPTYTSVLWEILDAAFGCAGDCLETLATDSLMLGSHIRGSAIRFIADWMLAVQYGAQWTFLNRHAYGGSVTQRYVLNTDRYGIITDNTRSS